jgi:FtsP/CotA-like multicopper oxidase with cupredoxin domain
MCLGTLVIAIFASGSAHAVPASPTDETKVPHYYGPYPNWVLSQLPAITPGACSVTTATACTTDANCPTAETCVGAIATGGIKKFVDGLPLLCDPTVGCTDNNLGQHIPLAVPDTTTFTTANGFTDDADYYVIALVQHREKMSSSLPGLGTLQREYVQLSTSTVPGNGVALMNDLPDGTSVAAMMPDGVTQAIGVDDPHYMGPIIAAQKDRPVRIVFYNLLPTGSGGDLFLPVDTSFMGSGMGPLKMMAAPMDQGSVLDMVRNPACGETTKHRADCFAETRASIHLHGGITPWISDGNPHQWITPANEKTRWPEGVSVSQVPDMVTPAAATLGVPNCSGASDGCTTFYYTNQQSARLMFYHDHAWGITRLNVYAGEAAGYLISDSTEQALITAGTIPADQIPLIIQDRTFVPNATQLAAQDPTWDSTRWGQEGDLWYEHVYMPAQNPNDPSGASPYGRWFYGPYFWPPAAPLYGPIANPYYNPNCDLGDPTTYTYQVDPFCEPPTIPGTPNNSAGMEQFNDTPIVNGTAYPTITVDPKAYRLRILNAANDRFFNLQMYVGDPNTASTDMNGQGVEIGPTEVALDRHLLAQAQDDPNVFPTPDTVMSPQGPSWIQIGTEGGFLPAPAVIPNRPTTWNIDPTRFDVGNVNNHSLTLGPAERADVIVDFSEFAGKTIILYNDAPAAFPARISTYDYYTGAPDLSPAGAPTVMPGYGPNTRTIMQIKISTNGGTTTATPNAVNQTIVDGLTAAFAHHADGSGVFESGQHPIIVGQAAYNSAYFDPLDPAAPKFTSGGWCNGPGAPLTAKCDGFARISEQGHDLFKFNTLLGSKIGVKIEPKALHDETNATDFEPYGRMSGNIGVEAVPATSEQQSIVLFPFVNPPTEIFNGTNLPTTDTITPIAKGNDGTQIWKLTHNGVDTHPLHFHLYDVQVLNRVTWDNIIIPPDINELGWKDTVRVSPLEDTYFAIRPVIPKLPFEIPNSIRKLNPMMPFGDTSMFNSVDINGNPTNPIANMLVNFGWEYMLHCHILSHEEMDMMRPVSVAMPPLAPSIVSATPSGNDLVLTWNDNSITETEFVVQRNAGFGWGTLGIVRSPLSQPNTEGVTRSFTDTNFNNELSYNYRVIARNTIGYLRDGYPRLSVRSVSDLKAFGTPAVTAPTAPSNLVVTAAKDIENYIVTMTWRDNSTNESGFQIQWATNADFTTGVGSYTTLATSYITTLAPNTYYFRVRATNAVGPSRWRIFGPVLAP